MIKILTPLLAALVLAACSSTSGALKTGPDTFTISTSASPGKGGVTAAKRIAYTEAGAACSQRGLGILVVDEKAESPTWTDGMAHVDLNFRCLHPNDSEFQRPR